MSREVTKTADGFRITIDDPIEKQTVIVYERGSNVVIQCKIHTNHTSYSVFINRGHVIDLISSLQEIMGMKK